MNGCDSAISWRLSEIKLFLGNNGKGLSDWGRSIGFYFFVYMLDGPEQPIGVPGYPPGSCPDPPPWHSDPNEPMNAVEAYNALNYYGVNPDTRKDPAINLTVVSSDPNGLAGCKYYFNTTGNFIIH